MRSLILVVASMLIAVPLKAQDCKTDTLAAVVNDHDANAPYVLVTVSGRHLRAYGQDFIRPTDWHARDPLSICAGADSGSLRVRNLRRGQELVTAKDLASVALLPLQIMNGPGFRALLSQVDVQCPKSRVRFATPAALLDVEDSFEALLDAEALRRLHAAEHRTANGEFGACVGRDGASCPANQAMDAFERAGLTNRFANTVCKRGAAPWD